MKIKYFILFFTAVSTLFSSCLKKEVGTTDTLLPEVKLGDFVKEKTQLSELLEEYTVIPLQSTDESIIGGRSNKIIKSKGKFFVQSMNDVVIFDETGNFEQRLSRNGGGPGEYQSLLDFDIAPELDEIWVSSMKGVVRYKIANLEFCGFTPLQFYATKIKCLGNDSFIARTPNDKVFYLCSIDGEVLETYFDKDLANSGEGTVQFVELGQIVASPLADSNSAVCYVKRTKEFSIQNILPTDNGAIVTMETNREYFDTYGEMEFSRKIMADFAGLISFREHGDQAIVSIRYPGRKNAIALRYGDQTKEYMVRPAEESVVTDDIFGKDDASFLLSFGAAVSDDSFLFAVENDDPDQNPSILEVKKFK